MPTPIGHSLAGLTVRLAARRRPLPSRGWSALLILILANLPDIDFLPGYLVGDPRAYHWGPAHSFAAALLVGLVIAAVGRARGWNFLPLFLIATAVYSSHLLLDLMLGPGAPSVGLQIFWPISHDRFMMPWSVFAMAPKTIETIGPVGALFSWEILPVIAREVAFLLPLAAATWALTRTRRAGEAR